MNGVFKTQFIFPVQANLSFDFLAIQIFDASFGKKMNRPNFPADSDIPLITSRIDVLNEFRISKPNFKLIETTKIAVIC